MNKNKQTTTLIISWTVALIVFGYFLNPTAIANAETSVTNSVHVTANSNGGETNASVITVLNGEVIEDWSTTSTEPIEYSHTYSTDTETISVSVNTEAEVSTSLTQTSTRDQLKAMIAHLEALISLYVLLLHN